MLLTFWIKVPIKCLKFAYAKYDGLVNEIMLKKKSAKKVLY